MNTRYRFNDEFNETPTNNHEYFQLHTHDEYEILLFLEGDSKYIIENKTYLLEPGDIIIIRKHELHRIYHNSAAPYRRIVLFVSPAFFQENNCLEYEKQFSKVSANVGNKIPASVARSSGIYDAFFEYKKFSASYTLDMNSPILKYIIIKILFLINQTSTFSVPESSNTTVKSIILYLNKHYTENITLDLLQEKFYISKHYLCKVFRKATGLTVHEYIRMKRLAKVRELRSTGLSLIEAAMQTGFHDYSAFYRAYTKEYGAPPSKDSADQT